jgi:hypothetical protein
VTIEDVLKVLHDGVGTNCGDRPSLGWSWMWREWLPYPILRQIMFKILRHLMLKMTDQPNLAFHITHDNVLYHG